MNKPKVQTRRVWVVIQPGGDIESGVLGYTRNGAIECFEDRFHWSWKYAKRPESGYRVVRATLTFPTAGKGKA